MAEMTTLSRSDREIVLRANLPDCCPQCSSRMVAPLYWVDVDVWDCADCGAIWSEKD